MRERGDHNLCERYGDEYGEREKKELQIEHRDEGSKTVCKKSERRKPQRGINGKDR